MPPPQKNTIIYNGFKSSAVTYLCLQDRRLSAPQSAYRCLGDDSVTHSEVWGLSVHQQCCYHNNHYVSVTNTYGDFHCPKINLTLDYILLLTVTL